MVDTSSRPKIKLILNDGEFVEIDRDAAEHIGLFKEMVEADESLQTISIPSIKRPILEKLVVFCEHLRENAPPEIQKPLPTADLT